MSRVKRAGLLAASILIIRFAGPITSVGAADSQTIYLDYGHPIPALYAGPDAFVHGLASPASMALSLLSDDFDHDGVSDLAVGYSTPAGPAVVLHRGNLNALAPQDRASFEAIAESHFPPPFLPGASVIAAPDRPDFLGSGVFKGEGDTDLIVAARDGSAIYVMSGDGKRNFQPGQTIMTPGPISALGTFRIDATARYTQVFAGVRTPSGPQLLVYTGSPHGLVLVETLALSSDVTGFEFGVLDGDAFSDVLVVSGGGVSILHGRDLQASGRLVHLDSIPVNYEVSAAALGIFVHAADAPMQMALLARDGTVHLLTQAGLAPSTSASGTRAAEQTRMQGQQAKWREIESFPAVAPFDTVTPPLMFRTRISGNSGDDLMVLNAAGGQVAVITHPNRTAGGAADSFTPGVILTRPDSSFGASAALQMRVNVDGRPGVVFVKPQRGSPFAMMPLPDPVFSVNTTNDTVDANLSDGICADANGQCSLRAAVMQANHDTGNDTILVPAGTYLLTLTGPNKETAGETDTYGSLDIFNGVSIIGQVDGSGKPTTIISAGTNSSNGIDKVFAVNPDSASAFDTSFSNLQIQFGMNPGSYSGGRVLPHGFGGGLSWQGNLTGNMSLTNCVITDNSTLDGDGGGIAINSGGTLGAFNGTGVFTISNSVIQRNAANESSTGNAGTGGGIWVGTGTALVVTNSQIINNNAIQVARNGGMGGGLFFSSPGNSHNQGQIHGSTVAGNQSTGHGAGIYTTQSITIDQGSVISGNSGADQGGGIWTTSGLTTLARVSITGNSATSQGGGIYTGSPGSQSNQLFMTFSRIAGNTAPSGSNLSSQAGTITATLNWWGTNSPAGTISGAVSFDPFITLSNTASPAKIGINQSATITASFLQDDQGDAIAANNLIAFVGLPITFNNAVLGTIPTAEPESIQANGTATAVFNAGSTGGLGQASATVDNGTAVATIIILQPPSVSQTFTPAVVNVATPSTVTFSIANGNVAAINASFADNLPVNLVIAPTPNVVNTCGGSLTASSGSSIINFANSALAPGNCIIKVDLISAASGAFTNSMTISSPDAGASNTSSATLTVLIPPITQSFNPAIVTVGAPSTITFTVNNANAAAINATFVDSLATSLVVAPTPNVVNNCGGTLTAVPGASNITFVNAALAPGTCTVRVDVSSSVDGIFSSNATTNLPDAGTGNTASANLTVINPPTITKSFSTVTAPVNVPFTLVFTLSNSNLNWVLNGVAFNDSLPATMQTALPNVFNNSCGGTIGGLNTPSTVGLSGVTLARGASCTFSISVVGIRAASLTNTVSVSSTNGGTGNTSSASVTVVAPPTIQQFFGAASVAVGGSTTLNFIITNPNASTTLDGIGFSDTLPSGLVISTPNGLSGACGGTVAAQPGGNVFNLSGGVLSPGGSCTLSVNVSGTLPGTLFNATGNVTSAEGGSGNGSAPASITVMAPPSISAAFTPSSIGVNATASLNFTIKSPAGNPTPLVGVAFTDALPSGLGVTNGTSSVCGGTLTVSGGNSITLAGATVSSTCSFSVGVTGTQPGQFATTTSAISSGNAGNGNTATTNLTVAAPPSVSEAFAVQAVALNQTTLLNFTIVNPSSNGIPLTGIAFTDGLPAGLIVGASGLVNSTCGGVLNAVPGSASIGLFGATLATGASCTIAVSVQGTAAGTKTNSTGAVSSNESGAGPASNSATLTVVAGPTVTMMFGASSIPLNGTISLTFSIANPNSTASLANIGITDTLPSGLTLANGVTGTCLTSGAGVQTAGSLTVHAQSNSIALAGLALAGGGSCSIAVNVTGVTAGLQADNSGNVSAAFDPGSGQLIGITGGPASANVIVVAPPSISQTFGTSQLSVNATTSLSVTITNPTGNAASLTGVGFTDPLPSGIAIGTPNGLANTCGGTTTAVPGSSTLSLTGGTIAVGASCTVAVNVTGIVAGNYTVTSGAVASANGGSGNAASASIAVGNAPAASIIAYNGASQTISDAGGANPFQALVLDASGLAVPGAVVTFGATSGGSFLGDGLSITGGLTATAVTNAQGIASSPIFVISGAPGAFPVIASVTGLTQTATFVVTVVHTNLNIVPSVLAFNYNSGNSNVPASQTINISQDTAFVVSVLVSPSNGWLTAVLGTTTTTSASVIVTVNPTGLAPGTYSGSIILDFGSRQVTIYATLTVAGQATLVPSPSLLSFAAVSGQGAPPTQTIALSSQGQGVGFTIATSAPWIITTTTSSTTPGSVTVAVDPVSAGLAVGGTISGSVQITASGATNSPLTIPVTLTMTQGLAITPGGFANAASWQLGPGAPNTIMALAGSFACGSKPSVLVSNQSVEVIGSTAGLVTFTLPASVDGQTSVPVSVACNGQQSDSINIPLTADAPGIFTLSMNGLGQGAVLNWDLTVNGPSNPAAINSFLAVYGTGFGSYAAIGPDGLQRLNYNVQAFLGDVPAQVVFAGHAPDSTFGLQQINVMIPPGAPSGPSVPIRLVINGVSTQAGVTVAIQ